MRKLAFSICKNKDADQLRGNREADQRLCFCYTGSTISKLPKSTIVDSARKLFHSSQNWSFMREFILERNLTVVTLVEDGLIQTEI